MGTLSVMATSSWYKSRTTCGTMSRSQLQASIAKNAIVDLREEREKLLQAESKLAFMNHAENVLFQVDEDELQLYHDISNCGYGVMDVPIFYKGQLGQRSVYFRNTVYENKLDFLDHNNEKFRALAISMGIDKDNGHHFYVQFLVYRGLKDSFRIKYDNSIGFVQQIERVYKKILENETPYYWSISENKIYREIFEFTWFGTKLQPDEIVWYMYVPNVIRNGDGGWITTTDNRMRSINNYAMEDNIVRNFEHIEDTTPESNRAITVTPMGRNYYVTFYKNCKSTEKMYVDVSLTRIQMLIYLDHLKHC